MKTKIVWVLTVVMAALLIPRPISYADSVTEKITYKYGETEYTRNMEKLDRGLIAIQTEEGVYLSWRLSGAECSLDNISAAPYFNVYRNDERIDVVKNSTNYLDTDPGTKYSVAPVINGVEGERCANVNVMNNNYFDIPIQAPADFVYDNVNYPYNAGDISCGDLDGDGEYELVVKWDANPQDSSMAGVTGNVYLDAYKMDGTHMWRVDLGRNIRSGEHYTQFLVYDFDSDGKAEVTAQTAPGSIDGNGIYVSQASNDPDVKNVDDTAVYVNSGGYIIEGPEFFTIFDGQTGRALDTIDYPVERVSVYTWGDEYGGRCGRYLASVAYLDGEKPYAVYWKGYYGGRNGLSGRTGIFGASFDGERLNAEYIFDTLSGQPGYAQGNEIYIGQGNHNMTVADIDNDGKDEFISGSLCMEVGESNQLIPKWCSFRGHGDALHIGDYDPTHEGLEYFSVHEGDGVSADGSKILDWGFTVYDAESGEELYHAPGSKDTGRGIMANVGAGGYYQAWAGANSGYHAALGNGEFTDISMNAAMNFRIFWDGDLYDELLDGTVLTNWNGTGMETAFEANDCFAVNGTKNVPALQADLFGDWREEIVYPLSDRTGLRVYSTTDLTVYKLPTLMHDPVYRSGVAAEQTAYNQPPHIGYYLNDEMFDVHVKSINITPPEKTAYNVGEELDKSGITVTVIYDDDTEEVVYNYTVSGYSPYDAGEQQISISYQDYSESFLINVQTNFVQEDGVIVSYTGDGGNEIIPYSIDGTKITGIADGVVTPKITELEVFENIEEIGNNNDFSSTTILCYEGSAAHVFAINNSIKYQTISTDKSYYLDVTFDETAYENLQMSQTQELQKLSIDDMTYSVYGRSGAGDGNTGFSCADTDNGKVLNVKVGRFCQPETRNANIDIGNVPMYDFSNDYVLEMKIKFNSPSVSSQNVNSTFIIMDANGEVDRVTAADTPLVNILLSEETECTTPNTAGLLEHDVWYTYKLIAADGEYYRFIQDENDQFVCAENIGKINSDTGISKIKFAQAKGSEFVNNSYYSSTYIDDFSIYTSPYGLVNSDINIVDKDGNGVSGAQIDISGIKAVADNNGSTAVKIPQGVYNISVTGEGYYEKNDILILYKKDASKTIKLERTPVPAQSISLDKLNAGIALRGGIYIDSQIYPNNSTDTVVWTTSDPDIAKVIDGYVRGLKEGSAVITATAGNVSASCNVIVKDTSDYEQVPYSIDITSTFDTVYIPYKGEGITESMNAVVYDEYGIEIEGCAIEWSSDSIEITDSGALIIPSGMQAGKTQVKAECGGVYDTIEIELKDVLDGRIMYTDSVFDDVPNIVQMSQLQEIDREQISYYVNGRNGGGDLTTGIYQGIDGDNLYLIIRAGEYNTSSRNAYIILNNYPSTFNEEKDYVFETDICFPSSLFDERKITIGSGSTPVKIINANKFDADVWYTYKLIRDNGIWYEAIYDADGNLISFEQTDVMYDNVINRIDYTASAARYNSSDVYIDNLKCYEIDEAICQVKVKAADKYGQEYQGVNIRFGNIVSVTNAEGLAMVSLPVGVYTAYAEYYGTMHDIYAVSSEGAGQYTCVLPIAYSMEQNGKIIKINSPQKVNVYCAEYDENNIMTGIEVYEVNGKTIFESGFEPDRVFVWDDMKPVE